VCLQQNNNFKVIGTSENGATAISEIRDLRPDFVLTELNLEAISGINLIRKVKAVAPEIRIILLSAAITPAVIHKALSSGVDGIILKNDHFSLLIEALSVIHTRKFLSPGISDPLVNNFLSMSENPSVQKISPLSDREEQVAKLIAEGESGKEIGRILSISDKTVSKHRCNIFKKLKINNTAQLVRYVYDNNMID
jgi:DNA-binding NarL/FixJ family response regulator